MLRELRSPTSIAELWREATDRGPVDREDLTNLVTQLIRAGVATCGPRNSTGRTRRSCSFSRSLNAEFLLDLPPVADPARTQQNPVMESAAGHDEADRC